MPCTALKIEKEDGSVVRIKFLTVGYPDYIDIDLFQCNEDFIPIGEPIMTQQEIDEAEYHKKLRLDASERNQYVPEESTDRHWNPGYIEPPDEDEDQTQP